MQTIKKKILTLVGQYEKDLPLVSFYKLDVDFTKKFENHFEQKLKDYEEKKDMPYVSLLEKKFMSSTV